MEASRTPADVPNPASGLFGRAGQWLTTHVLLAYLIACVAQRLWAALHGPIR
jgi:hypothetical protein